jgi:hypothetical protein
MLEHKGQLHKGFLSKSLEGVYQLSYKSHINKKNKDWGVNIPKLPTTWQDLCVKRMLLPGHQRSSLMRPRLPSPSTNFVYACNLQRECLHSLLVALDPSHPGRSIWLDSFQEEKSGIQSQITYVKIGLAEYHAHRAKGAPCAIPLMYVLMIKKDEMLNPIRAKSRIDALGNHKDCIWTKSDKYTPILLPYSTSLIPSMSVEKCCTLKQGDCKNKFCQSILPDDKITIIKP